jgi:hypothetical protein
MAEKVFRFFLFFLPRSAITGNDLGKCRERNSKRTDFRLIPVIVPYFPLSSELATFSLSSCNRVRGCLVVKS